MEAKRPAKRVACKSRINGEPSKVKRRLDFSDANILEKILVNTNIAMASPLETVCSSAPTSPDKPSVPVLDKPASPTTDIKLALGNNRFLVYSVFRGADKFHIRQYEEKDGVLIPSKIGVCMSSTRFAAFRFKMADIDERVDDFEAKRNVDAKIHVGGELFATVKTGYACVNLRKYWYPVGMQESVPSRGGIALRLPEWQALKTRVEELVALKPELVNVECCFNQGDHQNQIVYFNCGECNHLSPDFVPW